MDIAGSRLIPASQERTWKKLVTPDTLKVCISGCEKVEQLSDHEYRVSLRAEVGPVSAHFQGHLELTDIKAPGSYHLVFEGDGGLSGAAKGYADIHLEPDGERTRVSYVAHADLAGRLSQLRPAQAEKIARKMMDNFFSLFTVCASRTIEPTAHPSRLAGMAASASAHTPHLSSQWSSRLSWLAAGAVIGALIAYHAYLVMG
jgi:hypothetical protein